MSAHQDIFGFVHPGRHRGGAAVIGVVLLHQPAMRPRDLFPARAFRKAKHMVGLMVRHAHRSPRPSSRLGAPRVAVEVRCLTPAGKAAVEISFEQTGTLEIGSEAPAMARSGFGLSWALMT